MDKITRRSMLQVSATGLLGSMVLRPRLWASPTQKDILGPISNLQPRGQSYAAVVPDTLDLAQRAELSINALTGNLDPDLYSAVYQDFQFIGKKPKCDALTWNISPKNARTLPTMRVITGTDFGVEREYQLMSDLVSHIKEDGQMYYPFDGDGPPKGTSYPQTNANTALALTNWYGRDQDARFQQWISLLSAGLKKSVIVVEDRAYYPMQSGISPDRHWTFMNHSGDLPIPYTPPAEPASDQQGLEGASKSDSARCMSVLLRHYKTTGDVQSLEIGRRIGRFLLKPALWDDTSKEGSSGREHCTFSGHAHNNTNCLMALLDLALIDDNDALAEAVREGYNHQLRTGVVRMGWFPSWSVPTQYNRPAWLLTVTEPCALADTIALGVKLSDAGLGDYWDDVDSILRNHLIEQQSNDLDLMKRVSKVETAADEAMIKRFEGTFGTGSVTGLDPKGAMAGCCTANSPQGMYYAWHGITRFDGGVATVNLLLNRASAWMDIDSYLPYEGKVVLRNKQAHTAMVRIPAWVQKSKVKVTANGQPVAPTYVGSYLMIRGLSKGQVVTLEFPLLDRTDTYTIANREFEVAFRGSTVISVKARDGAPVEAYSFYRRQQYLSGKAPMRHTQRFVADNIIPLGPF
jgi:hypothetical protein